MSRLLALCAASSIAIAATFTAPADAALTPAEAAQVKDLYARAEPQSASKVRAMIARPDIVGTDIGELFADAARRVPFDDKHAAFLHDLLFGPASNASRTELVPVVVKGLLARSAEVAAAAGNDAGRGAELVRVHRFVARDIADAGTPPAEGHDGGALIRDDALRGAASLYKAHLALPVLERARLGGAILAGRAEAELALVELASGLVPRADVAAWLALGANGRVAFEKTGVLVFGLDGAPLAKTASVVAMLEAAAPAARDASALWIGKPRPAEVTARRAVLVAEAPLPGKKRVDPARFWAAGVEPSTPDAALAAVAFTLGRASFASSTLNAPGLASAADRALARAQKAGAVPAVLAPAALAESLDKDPGSTLTPASVVAHAAALLLLDAPRATSAALVLAVGGRNEPIEQLALALGALATGEDGKLRPSLDLGRTLDGGTVVSIPVAGIKGSPDKITDFTIDGHTITLARDEGGAVTRIDRDKRPLSLAAIPFATPKAKPATPPKR